MATMTTQPWTAGPTPQATDDVLVETPKGWRIVNALWRYADGRGPSA